MFSPATVRPASPLLPALLALCAGIYWQTLVGLPPYCALFIALCFIGLFMRAWKHQSQRRLFVPMMGCMFFSGAFLLSHDTHRFNGYRPHDAVPASAIIATIDDVSWHPGTPYRFHYKMTTTHALPTLHAFEKSVPVICYAARSCWWKVGDTIRLNNPRLTFPQPLAFEQYPGFEHYLAKENSGGSIFTGRPWARVLERPMISFQRTINNLRQWAYKKLYFRLSRSTFIFFSSIFLGLKTFTTVDPIKEDFGYWGLAHYLARSGLHIVLFIAMWSYFLRYIPLSYRTKNLLLFLLTLAYYLLSYSSISFLRALYAFFLIQVAKVGQSNQIAYSHLLTFIGISILLINPLQLFFLDFQLSFFITLALTLSSFFIPRAVKA